MNVELDITFQTAKSLSQETGLTLCGLGHYFNRVGPCTYRLKSCGEAASLADAEECVTEAIKDLVANAMPRWPQVVITQIKVKETAPMTRRET